MRFTYPLPGFFPPPILLPLFPTAGNWGYIGEKGRLPAGRLQSSQRPEGALPCVRVLQIRRSHTRKPLARRMSSLGCEASQRDRHRDGSSQNEGPFACSAEGGPGVSTAVDGRAAGQSLTAKMLFSHDSRGRLTPWDLHSFASGQCWTTGCMSQRTEAEAGRPFARAQGLREQAAWRVCIIIM